MSLLTRNNNAVPFLLFCFCHCIGISMGPPPPPKQPRTEKCLVQTDLYKGPITPCDYQVLQKLSDLANMAAPRGSSFGAGNLAELLLARSGIFDDELNLEMLHICSKHRDMLGTDWTKSKDNVPEVRKGGQSFPRCNIPQLAEYPHQYPHPNLIRGPRTVQTSQSKALWRELLTLVPPGTAMCESHRKYINQVEARLQDRLQGPDDAEINTADQQPSGSQDVAPTQQPSGSDDPAPPQQPSGSQDPAPRQSNYYESPIQYNYWSAIKRNQVCTSPLSSAGGSTQYSPSGSSQGLSQEQLERKCNSVKNGIRTIASAIGLQNTHVNFPQSYLQLDPATKARRANSALHITDAVMAAFAPDAPKVLMEAIIERRSGNWMARKKSEKFTELIKNVVDEYKMAPTRQMRLQILATIAPMLRYSELEKFLPGLTSYAFKEARRYAATLKAGIPISDRSTRRERYNRAKVELFIAFITSPNVVSDMPFGHYTIKLDSGLKEEIPNMIRTSVNKRIIDQYKSYLVDVHKEDMTLSDTTMWRILRACKATTRKSMLGLDYYTYEGVDGIANLIGLLDKLPKPSDADKEWTKEAKKTLLALKFFFKGDYKVYIQENSDISDYSRSYALSDPSNQLLQAAKPGETRNMRRCTMCIAMLEIFKGIESMIAAAVWQEGTQEKKKDAQFVFDKSKEGILEWQKHIVRTIHQNEAKEEILKNLESDSVWLLMDWAMKALPKKGVESAPEWFGKKGMNWHISVALYKDSTTDLFYTRTFAHIFDPVAQDAETVLAIIKDVIERIKSEQPQVQKVYLRSDNAGCYHSGLTLSAIPLISAATGIKIVRFDFSDPQSGKGACDRATSVIKRHVKQFVNEHNKCTTPAEFFACANSHRGVRSTTFIHAALDSPDGRIGKGSITGITPYHNFDFSNPQMKAWYAYKIGGGTDLQVNPRTLALPRLHPIHSVGTGGETHKSLLQVKTNWNPLVERRISPDQREPPPPSSNNNGWVPDDTDSWFGSVDVAQDGGADDPVAMEGPNRRHLYQCEEEGCTKVFQSYYNWFRHVTVGKHTKMVERQSLRDYSIKKYVENIQQSQALSGLPQIVAAIQSQHEQEATSEEVEALPMGWALKKRRQTKRFTQQQKVYLTNKFNEGAKTGIKYNPHDVAESMRSDTRFPNKDDWLTWTQIASFWSRLAQTRERLPRAQQSEDSAVPEENEIDLEEAGDDEYVTNFLDDIDETIRKVIDEVMDRE